MAAGMVVLLETTADVQAHATRAKNPKERLTTIWTASELGVPFRMGFLVGINEDWSNKAESILAIRELYDCYGHIQEFIIQQVVENKHWTDGELSVETFRRVVTMTRTGLPDDVSVQVPWILHPQVKLLTAASTIWATSLW